jgi:AcrR family transcriptional regulator
VTAPVATVPEAAARGGRPRDPSRDTVLVEATLALLAEDGYGALTMEAVAARAGVGKATLYRRWSSKEQLVVDALTSLSEAREQLSATGVRDQLVALLEAVRRKRGSLAGKIFPRLIGEAAGFPELMDLYRAQVHEPRRQRLRDVLRTGVEQGLVRPDVDLDHAVDLLVGPMVYRNLIRSDPPPGPELARDVVDDVLRALAPR